MLYRVERMLIKTIKNNCRKNITITLLHTLHTNSSTRVFLLSVFPLKNNRYHLFTPNNEKNKISFLNKIQRKPKPMHLCTTYTEVSYIYRYFEQTCTSLSKIRPILFDLPVLRDTYGDSIPNPKLKRWGSFWTAEYLTIQ